MKRQNGMRATPAGSEMKVRTIGSMRLKNTAQAPQRSNQRSARSRLDLRMCSHLPCFSISSMRPK